MLKCQGVRVTEGVVYRGGPAADQAARPVLTLPKTALDRTLEGLTALGAEGTWLLAFGQCRMVRTALGSARGLRPWYLSVLVLTLHEGNCEAVANT